MNEGDWLAERFEEQRPHLRAVAYRMLGSLTEADDAVQEALLVISRKIKGLRAAAAFSSWLFTVVRRECRAGATLLDEQCQLFERERCA